MKLGPFLAAIRDLDNYTPWGEYIEGPGYNTLVYLQTGETEETLLQDVRYQDEKVILSTPAVAEKYFGVLSQPSKHFLEQFILPCAIQEFCADPWREDATEHFEQLLQVCRELQINFEQLLEERTTPAERQYLAELLLTTQLLHEKKM